MTTASMNNQRKEFAALAPKSNLKSMVINVLFFGLLAYFAWIILDWAFVRAVFSADGADQCRAPGVGACWSVIATRWRLIFFGLFPYDQQWRSAVACLTVVVVAVLSCLPFFWQARRLSALWLSGFALFYILMRGGFFGLTTVFEQNWGGLALTIFIFASVVVIGMPLAVILALLRRSEFTIIARFTALFIDSVRAVPLLAIMFTFSIVLPLALPAILAGDKLYRVILGFAIFFACYQAEIIRGGMQAIPAGQEEAAKALGLSYWQRTLRIVLPQAFKHALPPTINQLVITFKETTLVTIVGFFDVLGAGGAAFGTGTWAFAYVEVYVVIALVFFAFVFSLSRYGAYLEKRMQYSN